MMPSGHGLELAWTPWIDRESLIHSGIGNRLQARAKQKAAANAPRPLADLLPALALSQAADPFRQSGDRLPVTDALGLARAAMLKTTNQGAMAIRLQAIAL